MLSLGSEEYPETSEEGLDEREKGREVLRKELNRTRRPVVDGPFQHEEGGKETNGIQGVHPHKQEERGPRNHATVPVPLLMKAGVPASRTNGRSLDVTVVALQHGL